MTKVHTNLLAEFFPSRFRRGAVNSLAVAGIRIGTTHIGVLSQKVDLSGYDLSRLVEEMLNEAARTRSL